MITFPGDELCGMVNIGQRGLEGNAERGKPTALSSPPSMGLISVTPVQDCIAIKTEIGSEGRNREETDGNNNWHFHCK
jgi:hypothetical protein